MVSSRRALSYASALILPLLVAASAAAQQSPPPTPSPETPPAAGGTSNATPPAGTAPQTAGAAGEETVGGTANAPKRKAVEEITVTGSRIRRKDLSTPAPVTVISREQVQNSATATIGDFLQMMPEQGNATNTQVNNGGNGTTQISLRSLGANRTLVLVDGKRFVYGGSGADASVDLNTIPSAAVERVEVLKDGASATYGSDAIAGVVNIITRHRMNGTEASAYAGVSQHGDAQVYDFNVTSGAAGEKGAFLFGAGYYDQHSFLSANRDWSKYALLVDYSDPAFGTPAAEIHGGSSRIPQGRVAVDPTKCSTTVCADLAAKFPGKKSFFYDPTNPLQVDGWVPYSKALNAYNYQAVNLLVTPSQRVSLFSNGEYRIAEGARAYFQGSFVNRQSHNLLAPEPLDTGNLGVVLDANNAYNPFGTTLTDVRKRLTSTGGRTSIFDIDTFRVVGGIDGSLPDAFGPAKGWFYDVAFNYGRNVGTTITNGSINALQVKNALGPSFSDATGLHCGTPGNAIAGCAPVNLFGINNPTPDQFANLGIQKLVNTGFNQETAVTANISGELFNLASDRAVGLALGYEYRREYGGFQPDFAAQQTFTDVNGLTSFTDSDYGSAPTAGQYHVNEGYGEIDVPLISHMPLVDDLEATAAVRVFDYNTFGSDYTYKFGGRWRPVRDVTFRATYSTAFRAPNVAELYSGAAPSAEFATDPCAGDPSPTSAAHIDPNSPLGKQCGTSVNNGDPNNQINSKVGGNAALQPEKSKAFTAGVVLEPQMVRNLTITADYYNIKIDNLIVGGNLTENLLLACYPGAGGTPDQNACGKILRSPTNNNQIALVNDYLQNRGSLLTDGLDLALRYAMPTDLGRVGLQFDGTYLLRYNQNLFQPISGAGNYDLGLNPRVKFNALVNYAFAGFGAGVVGHFIGGFRECPAGGDTSNASNGCYNGTPNPTSTTGAIYAHDVKPEMTFDVYASYLLRNPLGNTTISAGVRNALNTDPVRVYNSSLTFADPSAYDFVGRYFYGRLTHAF